MHSVKKYLFYTFIIFGTLLIISYIEYRINIIAQQDFKVWKWLLIKQFFYIPVGIALALPTLISNFSKKGSWSINYSRLIFLGVPALYFSFYLLVHFFTPLGKFWVPWFMMGGNELYKIGSTILGYILISSFYKYDKMVKED